MSSAIFLLLSLLAFWVQRTGYSAYQNQTRHDDAQRNALQAVEQMKAEFCREARLTLNSANNISLAFPYAVGDDVQVGPSGLPQYAAPSVTYSTDPSGNLVRMENGNARIIARLGRGGGATFALPTTNQDLLQITVLSQRPGNPVPFRLVAQVYLRNQQ